MTVPTVLVVDDERYIVDLLTELLEEEGYRVERAYDGEAALAIAERNAPDLVLADVMMPKMDGLSLAAKLHERLGSIPIILMSAAVRPRNPGIAFIEKPFDIDEILDIVDQLIRRPAPGPNHV